LGPPYYLVETDACNFQHPPGSGRLRSFIASRVPFWFTFHEDSVGGSKSDAPLEPGHVRGEEVVADQVESIAQSAGQLLPTLPVLLV
jgi:hypothetical protein